MITVKDVNGSVFSKPTQKLCKIYQMKIFSRICYYINLKNKVKIWLFRLDICHINLETTTREDSWTTLQISRGLVVVMIFIQVWVRFIQIPILVLFKVNLTCLISNLSYQVRRQGAQRWIFCLNNKWLQEIFFHIKLLNGHLHYIKCKIHKMRS